MPYSNNKCADQTAHMHTLISDICFAASAAFSRLALGQIQSKTETCFSSSISLFLDWLQSLEQFFINVPYHIRVASLTLMALSVLRQSHQS